MEKYYVVMTDKALSGWGKSSGKINKLILECDSYEQAKIVEANAKSRPDMKYVNITRKKPYYDSRRYFAQNKTIIDYPTWYKESAFK